MLAEGKLGKFSSSEIWKLLVAGTRQMTDEELKNRPKDKEGRLISKRTTVDTTFGETALTYIKEKAVEILTQRRKESFSTRSTDWGNEFEYKAIQEYNRFNFCEVEYFGSTNPKFYLCPKFEQYAGGSPDFIIDNIVGEVKCPYDSVNHFDNLLIKSQKEFKELHKDYYSQIQFNIHCTGSEIGHFVSYDWRFRDDKQLFILTIEKDKEHIDLILDRLSIAIDNLNELIR